MAGTWYCLKCYKEMGNKQYCPHCGAHRMGDMAEDRTKPSALLKILFGRRGKKKKHPLFSEEECFLYGIHPNDEMYRKTMEMNILSKDYRS